MFAGWLASCSGCSPVCIFCRGPAISLHSYHVSLVQWTTCLLPVMRDPGSNPQGVLVWNRDSPVNFVSLHCPSVGASRGSAPTMCKPTALSTFSGCSGYIQCVSRRDRLDHIALLSRFHACCWSSFQLQNRQNQLLGGGESPVQSLQSHFIITMSHQSSELPICFQSWGTQVPIPGGGTYVKPGFSC